MFTLKDLLYNKILEEIINFGSVSKTHFLNKLNTYDFVYTEISYDHLKAIVENSNLINKLKNYYSEIVRIEFKKNESIIKIVFIFKDDGFILEENDLLEIEEEYNEESNKDLLEIGKNLMKKIMKNY